MSSKKSKVSKVSKLTSTCSECIETFLDSDCNRVQMDGYTTIMCVPCSNKLPKERILGNYYEYYIEDNKKRNPWKNEKK